MNWVGPATCSRFSLTAVLLRRLRRGVPETRKPSFIPERQPGWCKRLRAQAAGRPPSAVKRRRALHAVTNAEVALHRIGPLKPFHADS